MSSAKKPHPKWVAIAIVIAILGLIISIYSTVHHIEVKASGATDAFCNISERFSCDDVARSPYSEVFGIPLGVWGAGYFTALLLLVLLGRRESDSSEDHLLAHSALVVIGVLQSIALGLISWFAIGVICLTCSAVYTLCTIQAVMIYIYRHHLPLKLDIKRLLNGGLTAVMAVVAVVILFQSYVWATGVGQPKEVAAPSSDSGITQSDEFRHLSPVMRFLASPEQQIPINRTAFSGLGEDFRNGPDNAPVRIVEFIDFMCPACAQAASMTQQIYDDFPGKVQIVVKMYSLDPGCNPGMRGQGLENSCITARLARCAGMHGDFWKFHQTVFERQRRATPTLLESWAQEAGVSRQQIEHCLTSNDVLEKIRDDIRLGDEIGVQGTPTIFINGRLFSDRSLDGMRAITDALIRQ